MEQGAKVKLRGVQVGQVDSIGTDVKAAQLQLKMQPGPFKYLPSNLEAEIKSTTAFGSKYVDLIVPEHPSPTPLKPGAVLHSRNVTVEVNTVFENLQSVVHAIDPAKLNAILSAFSESLRGKGERLGQAITDANNLLLTVNPRMDTIDKDWRLFGKTTAVYSDAAQNILSILDSAATTSTTLTDNQRSLDALLLSAVGFEPDRHQRHRPQRIQHRAVHQPARSDHSAAEQILADVHLLVPGCAVVRRPRRPRRVGRQRLLGDPGCRAALR